MDISVALQQHSMLQMGDPSPTILHVFANASPKAYGTAVYIQHGNHSSPVMSKSCVAPLKQHTLPRLELMAAAIAARLGSFVADSLNHNTVIHYWAAETIC